jgi:hypothetical protein
MEIRCPDSLFSDDKRPNREKGWTAMNGNSVDGTVFLPTSALAGIPGLGGDSYAGKLERRTNYMLIEAIAQPAPTHVQPYGFRKIPVASQRVDRGIDEVIDTDGQLDFRKPFMPEPLVRAARMDFLSDDEKLALSQIRGHAYLSIFGLVGEFLLPFALDHIRPALDTGYFRVRAFLQMASEEAKHMQLFKTFKNEFRTGFATVCEVIGPGSAVARKMLSYHPLSVALAILHLEWMAQSHYVDSIRDDRWRGLQFKELLKHRWLEVAECAQLDTLIVEALADEMTEAQIEKAVDDYLEIAGFLDEGLWTQANFDMEAFERATGRRLSEDERAQFLSVQHQANRWTYIGSGMTHPRFLSTLYKLSPTQKRRIEECAETFI